MEAIIHRLQSDPKYRLENEAAIAAYLSGEDPGRSVRFEDDE